MTAIKNIILFISFLGSLLAYMIFQVNLINVCDFFCDPFLGHYHRTLIFFPFLFFFSVITYKLPERVFLSWWKFARITAPVVLILAFLINLELHHTPGGDLQHIFDAPALWLLYILFSLGSIIQIYRGWREVKK